MGEINGLLQKEYFGNDLREYLIAVGVFLLVWLLLYLVKTIAIARLKKFAIQTQNRLDDYLSHTLAETKLWFLLVTALYVASRFLHLSDKHERYVGIFAATILFIQAALWANTLLMRYLQYYRASRLETDAASATTVAVLGFVFRLGIYSLTLMLILDNAGINVTALITGLGVGGIALALAAQNVLEDLFASLAIAFDKPFVLGDFIIVDDLMGSVQKIGMKTTRIRSLGGEQIILPNSDIMKSRIRNYKRMEERRIIFGLGVIYQTPYTKLQKIPGILQSVIENQDKTRFDRAHFKEYGDSSLNFEIVYYVLSADYNEYMDIQQKINLAIFREFEKEQIEFAYPTQTLFMEPSNVEVKQVAS